MSEQTSPQAAHQRYETERRNFQTGWCPEGITLQEASKKLEPGRAEQVWHDFPHPGEKINEDGSLQLAGRDRNADERRAAYYLLHFTGLQPRLRDTNEREGAVDITLESQTTTEVVEVTSTIHSEHQRNKENNERLMERVSQLYKGQKQWSLHLRQGWVSFVEGRDTENAAREIADELYELSRKTPIQRS